jgi:23S rRNA (pseudouridine1915-N3)-methyltransferase
MKIKIISAANKMSDWVDSACKEFEKRLDNTNKVEFIDIPLNTRNKNADIKRLIQKEAKAMLAATQDDDWVIALTVDGKSFSSERLAKQLKDWQELGKNLCIYIGGPEGLAEECLKRANQKISLSELTLPHPLVRVVLIEQLYRAQCILKGHPYHR